MLAITWSSTSAVLPPASRWTSARTATWSMPPVWLRGHLQRLVEGDPEVLVHDDPGEPRAEGSGAPSATTPTSALARLCPCWSVRENVEVLGKLLGETSAGDALLRTYMLRATGRPIARTKNQIGPRRNCDDRAEDEPGRGLQDQQSARVMVDLADVDVLLEPLDPAEAPPALLLRLPRRPGARRPPYAARRRAARRGASRLAEARDERLVRAECSR